MNVRSQDSDHIISLTSGSGAGAIGVLRLSGKNCWDLIAPCLMPPAKVMPAERTLILKSFVDPNTHGVVDELMIAWFKGPRSFTGEDSVELYCHGGQYIIQRLLDVIISQGARQALPGEFTKRALLNGKLDITAAEGIRDLVEAQTEQQWLSGRQLYSGKLRTYIEDLRVKVIDAMAWLEAMIDFPDEGDTQHIHLTNVTERVTKVSDQIDKLLGSFQSGHIASQGLMVVFAGIPNSGKSSLFNALLGKNRAIVSKHAGTTRDYIEERCLVNGRLIRLVDVAGLRDSSDQIEQEGIERSRQLIAEADLIIALYASDHLEQAQYTMTQLLTSLPQKPILKVLTKSDLARPAWANSDYLGVSTASDNGLISLKNKLAEFVDSYIKNLGNDAFITSIRQRHCLQQAKQGIANFWLAAKSKAGQEILAFELQAVARSLNSVVGDLSNEDVLDKIFSEFCVGK